MFLMRIGAVFIALCMVLIAASVGVALFLWAGLDAWHAATAALAALLALVTVNVLTTRARDRDVVNDRVDDLARGTSDLARQFISMDRRISTMETRVENALARTRAVTDPLTTEMSELSMVVRQLAESVAAQDAGRPFPPDTDLTEPAAILPAETARATETTAAPAAGGSATAPRNEIVGAIRDAIDANRVDLYLQPIVTLPQRKVRFYEATSRLRLEGSDILAAADFIPHAESAGLMPKIDSLMVFRCVQVVRRLLLKNRDIGVFCNISGATLADAAACLQLVEFMDANRAIAPSLIFEFTQDAWRAMGPVEHESLAALAARGFRFSLDNVRDLDFAPRELAARHVRFIKVRGTMLLSHASAALSTDIHPEDLSNLLARSGIDLVAEKIESESTVVDLLDFDVRFGQGFLFSQPRPVRAEALKGAVEPDLADPNDAAANTAEPEAAQGSQPSNRLAVRRGLAQLATSAVDRA